MKQLFGTDGIRARMGIEPFTAPSLMQLGAAIAQWAWQHYDKAPTILLGHDTRESCSLVKAAIQTGLLHYGAKVYDAHIVPTPAVYQIITRNKAFDLGLIISASHNPYQDNGIKLVDKKGKLSSEAEACITNFFYTSQFAQPVQYGITYSSLDAQDTYSHALHAYFTKGFLAGKVIVLDTAHGATSNFVTSLFSDYGGATVIMINNTPDGKNINHDCGALHLASLQKAVITHHADIGFAFDGDGDRVIAVNRFGMVKDGDDLLALLLEHPFYKEQQAIVGTIMTNQGFECFLQQHNKKLIRVAVGDKYVTQELERANLLLGGEQSGHIVIRDYLNTGDGIFTALRVLQTLTITDNWDMVTFEKFPQVLINVPISVKKDLSNPIIASIIDEYTAKLAQGRLLVRYSGTELLLRIMVEDVDLVHAQVVGEQLSRALSKNFI